MNYKKHFNYLLIIFFLLIANRTAAQLTPVAASAEKLINDSALTGGHIGICLFDPASNENVYRYNSDKYFIPASNVKLFTTYACLKFLSDSLDGIRFKETKDTLFIAPTGDPTFLNDDFKSQRVFNFIASSRKIISFEDVESKFEKFGKGWSWDDYNDEYMAERNTFPLYGNTISAVCKFSLNKERNHELELDPTIKYSHINFSKTTPKEKTSIRRGWASNDLEIIYNNQDAEISEKIPFYTNGVETAIGILQEKIPNFSRSYKKSSQQKISDYGTIKSEATDTVLRKMMFESNNFLAEQLLLMSSNKKLGLMSDQTFIDSMLANELKELPQRPNWVDGSGLSRYNLFTPESFVFLLNKMKNEFGLERLKNILPTGGKGTLKKYFLSEGNAVFAKTGTLSNHSSLSGYLITKKQRLLIFSVLINNYPSEAAPVKRAVERFIKKVIDQY